MVYQPCPTPPGGNHTYCAVTPNYVTLVLPIETTNLLMSEAVRNHTYAKKKVCKNTKNDGQFLFTEYCNCKLFLPWDMTGNSSYIVHSKDPM